MSDPLRTDPANDVPSGERDAKIEQLLLSGLDHYFDGEYDQAINVWTRALFLDRGHARARAYIERARSALAERQRESEELLQRGLAAFDRGASAEARRLLEAAIMRGAPRDEALSVLDRIHRLDPAEAAVLSADDTPDDRPRRRSQSVARTLQIAAWIALAVSVVVAAFVSAGTIPLDWLWLRTQQPQTAVPQLAPAPADAGPTVPRRGERALNRARVLAQNGHLRDALTNLGQVTITDDEKIEADRLRADIQRQLIALEQASGDTPAPPARPPGLTP